MQSLRLATCSSILRRRCTAVVTQRLEEAVEQSTSRHNKIRGRRCLHSRTSKNCKPLVQRKETSGDVCYRLTFLVRELRHCKLGLSQSRFFSASNRSSHTNWKRLDNKIDEEPKHILSLLQDTRAHPVGSLSPINIKEAEDALEYWVSASVAIPRKRKGRNKNPTDDIHAEEYKNCFENAKFICSRLVLEQKYHGDNTDGLSAQIAKSESIESVDGWFSEMQDDWDESNEIIDEDCYFVRPFLLNRVVDCWRLGWRDGRLDVTPNEMIAWVEDMDNSKSDARISDSRTLTMIVDGICLRGDPYEAPLLAQWLLDRRLGQAQDDEEDTSLRPDTIFFTNVIRSWAKSGRFEAPEMAEGLLRMMHELYINSGWIESAPNAYSYSATMEAWSNSQRHPDSTERIEALLEEMKNSDLMQVVPDRVSYQYVLNAWANSKTKRGAERAYEVLQEMIALYEAGNVLVAPNTSNFSRVILASAQSGNEGRVDQVLEQLQDLYAKTGDPNFEPTDECWRACIIAKAKTGGVEEAQAILDDFVDRAVSKGKPHLMPRRGYFIDTLVAWTKVKDQKKAAEMSQKVLDRMVELSEGDDFYRNLRPDSKTYEKVILAWSRSRHHTSPEHILSLLREMERQYDMGDHRMRPSLVGYTNLMLAWQRSGRRESTQAIQHVFDSLQSQYRMPWKKHLRPDRFVFGILIDSWARHKDFDRVESIFEEMISDWRNGNHEARPDIRIFHNILRAHSKENGDRDNAIMNCEHYFSVMKEVGLPATIEAYSYLIHALSSKLDADNKGISRASEILDELLDNAREGKMIFPPKYREYRQFLKIVSNSCIPHWNQQAKNALKSLPQAPGPIPKELLSP